MKTPLILLAFLSTILFGCSTGASDADAESSDSILTLDNIRRQVMVDPHNALALLDSAEAHGRLDAIDINGMRAVIYHNMLSMSNVALVYAEQAYEAAEQQADTVAQIKSLKMLAGLYFTLSHYSEALDYATRGLGLIADADVESQAFFLQLVGQTKVEIESVDAGMAYIDRAIDIYQRLAHRQGGSSAADDWLYACMQKVNLLQANNRFEQALEALTQCNEAFEMLANSADANELIADHRRAEVQAINMLVLHHCGQSDRAAQCYADFNATEYSHTIDGNDLAIPYLIEAHQYDEALARLNTAEIVIANTRDTVSEYFVNTVLDGRLKCLQAKGQWRQALGVSGRIKVLTDSLYLRENALQNAQQAIIFRIKDYELQMVAQQQQLDHQHTALIVGTIILAILIALAATLLYYNRKIQRKNRAAVALIEELSASHSIQCQEIIEREPQPVDPAADDQTLFDYLNRRIIAENLYLRPNFHREDAAALANVPLKRLSAVFRQFANGFPGYINGLRLEHSVELLRTKVNYTVEGIAQECGFSNRQTYHRLFVEKYAMTPAEFRRSALSS